MTYDSDISEVVSLSRILDHFMDESESPSIILGFLLCYDSSTLTETISRSVNGCRIFELDFLGMCSRSEIEKHIEVTRVFSERQAYGVVRFLWKVMQSNLDEVHKRVYREMMEGCRIRTYMKHPYTGSTGAAMKAYESVFTDIRNGAEDISSFFNSMDDGTFYRYMLNLRNSLFSERLCMSDVFCMLNPSKQYMLIAGGEMYELQSMRILESDVDVEVKYALYRRMSECVVSEEHKPIVDEILKDVENYPQLSMRIRLYGEDEYARAVIKELLFSNFDMLAEMYAEEPEIIRSNYDISELIEYAVSKSDRKND